MTDAQATDPGSAPDAIDRLIAKSGAVRNLDLARICLRDAAKELDQAEDPTGHRHVMALMASTDDALEALAGGAS